MHGCRSCSNIWASRSRSRFGSCSAGLPLEPVNEAVLAAQLLIASAQLLVMLTAQPGIEERGLRKTHLPRDGVCDPIHPTEQELTFPFIPGIETWLQPQSALELGGLDRLGEEFHTRRKDFPHHRLQAHLGGSLQE